MDGDNFAQYVQSPDAVAEVLDGDTVVKHRATRKYYGLDPVGSAIWELLTEPHSQDAICAALVEQFDVEEAACRQAVDEYLDKLLAVQLVQPVQLG